MLDNRLDEILISGYEENSLKKITFESRSISKKKQPTNPKRMMSSKQMAKKRRSQDEAEAKNDTFQLGTMAEPCHVVWGSFPSDRNKATNSAKVIITDQATIDLIQALEEKCEKSFKGKELNSIIKDVKENPFNDEEKGALIRIKFTKKESNYSTVDDQWSTGAAANLTQIDYGHQFVAIVKPATWTRDKECGVTLYANLLHCVGRLDFPWGRDEAKKQEPPVWK